ncbi:uncharacterized protein PRCAT00003632001 [Priceomyces carsonii]|uniref:uncharacterized protein n=1 Tax=Priceomyces carsonii TaxID=28549 RepID=UPI002EDB58E9|nr:unnamed protein product [Priceomyces carsonii]
MNVQYINSLGREMRKSNGANIPLNVLLKLNNSLRKTILSKKFYEEVTDKVLTKTSTVDTNLYFICYFTLLVSSILSNKGKIKRFLLNQKCKLINLINKVAFHTFGVQLKDTSNKKIAGFFQERPQSSAPSACETSNLAVHLKEISTYLSDIRIFNRLFDSIKYIPWVLSELTALRDPSSSVSKLDRIINLLQSLNCLILELLENAGWLTDHNWVGTNDNTYWCVETYIWCCRVWGLYLVIEIIELLRRTPMNKWNKDWRISLFSQLIQIPLVVHWSLYEGCLSPFWVGLCGSGASWFNFKNLWLSLDLK